MSCRMGIDIIEDRFYVRYRQQNVRDMAFTSISGARRQIADGDLIAEGPVTGLKFSEKLFGAYFAAFTCFSGDFLDGDNVIQLDSMTDWVTAGFGCINGPKWKRPFVQRRRGLKTRQAKNYFKPVVQNEAIRDIVRDSACGLIPPEMNRFIYDSFVSTEPTLSGVQKFINKMSQKCMKWDMPDDVVLLTFMMMMKDLVVASTPIDLKRSSIKDVPRNPAASPGFRDDAEDWEKKGQKWPYAVDRFSYGLDLMAAGMHPMDAMLDWGHILMAKAEVRKPDDEIDKIRLIATQSCEAELGSDLISRALMKMSYAIPWCSVGHSQYDNATYGVLYGLKHPLANVYLLPTKAADVVHGACFYVNLDISGLDYSMVPMPFLLLSVSRMLLYDWDSVSPETSELFKRLFTVEMAWSNAKLLETFGEHWYLVAGVMLSGYKCTSVFDTMMVRWALMCALCTTAGEHFPTVAKLVGNVIYGDDCVLRLPMALLPLVSSNNVEPDLLALGFKRCGMRLKLDQTDLLLPTPDIPDRFFSYVKDDVLQVRGVRYLQKYYVKLDAQGNPLHPATPLFHSIGMWRPTEDYLSKMANHPYGWRKQIKESEPDLDPEARLYLKAFASALECCANRTVNEICVRVMRRLKAEDPLVVERALAGVPEIADRLRRLGEVDMTMLRHLPDHPTPYLACLEKYGLTLNGLKKLDPLSVSKSYSRMV